MTVVGALKIGSNRPPGEARSFDLLTTFGAFVLNSLVHSGLLQRLIGRECGDSTALAPSYLP
jgi:hypothetical protein